MTMPSSLGDEPGLQVRRFQHPRLDFALAVPGSAEVRVDLPGVALAVIAPADRSRPDAFRGNLNVVVEAPADGVGDLEAYQELSWRIHEERLDRLDLLDRETTTLAGIPSVRTLAHHLQAGVPLLLEQWRFVLGARGWTASVTLPPLEAPELRPVFVAALESLTLGGDA